MTTWNEVNASLSFRTAHTDFFPLFFDNGTHESLARSIFCVLNDVECKNCPSKSFKIFSAKISDRKVKVHNRSLFFFFFGLPLMISAIAQVFFFFFSFTRVDVREIRNMCALKRMALSFWFTQSDLWSLTLCPVRRLCLFCIFKVLDVFWLTPVRNVFLSLSAYVAYVRTKFWRRAQKEKKNGTHTKNKESPSTLALCSRTQNSCGCRPHELIRWSNRMWNH